jgi:hypothetical protein
VRDHFAGPRTSINCTGPAVLNWAHLVDAAGFLALGAVLAQMLTIAGRSSAAQAREALRQGRH